MMKVALGLLVATMSHELGVLFALATLPGLVLAARPSLLAVSPSGYLVSMFFPVVAAVLSLFFVSAVLKTNFFAVQLIAPDSGWAGATFLALLCLLPVPVMVFLRLFMQARFSMPLGGIMLTLVGMALLNRVYPVEPDPVLVAAPALGRDPGGGALVDPHGAALDAAGGADAAERDAGGLVAGHARRPAEPRLAAGGARAGGAQPCGRGGTGRGLSARTGRRARGCGASPRSCGSAWKCSEFHRRRCPGL